MFLLFVCFIQISLISGTVTPIDSKIHKNSNNDLLDKKGQNYDEDPVLVRPVQFDIRKLEKSYVTKGPHNIRNSTSPQITISFITPRFGRLLPVDGFKKKFNVKKSINLTNITEGKTDPKAKVEKLKNFMKKNQILLKDIAKDEFFKEIQNDMPKLRADDKESDGELLWVDVDNDPQIKQRKKALRIIPGELADDLDITPRLPKANQLDMIHAKGTQAKAKRSKGLLCQRHVANIEGPRYDSKGNIYMRRFTKKVNLSFRNTIAPKFVLPRCCNCCKKSVLGCE